MFLNFFHFTQFLSFYFSSVFLEDLQGIFNFIYRDSTYYAKIILDKIHVNMLKLKFFPQMGRKVPEFNKNEFRELIIQNYRVVYHN